MPVISQNKHHLSRISKNGTMEHGKPSNGKKKTDETLATSWWKSPVGKMSSNKREKIRTHFDPVEMNSRRKTPGLNDS